MKKSVCHKIFDFRFFCAWSPWPPSNLLGAFQIFTTNQGDIHNFVIIAGVNNTVDKLFTDVKDTSDIVSPVTKTPVMNLSPMSMTPAMKHLRQNQLAYISK
jgi:hypothetical protein